MSTGVVTLGETMGLMRATEVGSLEHVSGLALHTGGAESNVAIGLARLGVPATWIGRVGDDPIGRRVLRELRAEQVAVHGTTDSGAPTGLMIKERPATGRSRVVYYRSGSAGSRLAPEDLDLDAIRGASLVHITGITPALSDSAARAVDAAVDAAVAAGIPVSFDINHRAALWAGRDPLPVYRALAERATIVFAGDDEAQLVVGAANPLELVRRLSALGASQAVVKLGARGCAAVIDGDIHVLPAQRAEVVDTVGAGDAFVAGYLAALLEGAAPRDRLLQATRCGALACEGPGDWESLPRRQDLSRDPGRDPVSR